MVINPIALRTAKTPQSFGRLECNGVNEVPAKNGNFKIFLCFLTSSQKRKKFY